MIPKQPITSLQALIDSAKPGELDTSALSSHNVLHVSTALVNQGAGAYATQIVRMMAPELSLKALPVTLSSGWHKCAPASEQWWVAREIMRAGRREIQWLDSSLLSAPTSARYIQLPLWHFVALVPENLDEVSFFFSREDALRDKRTVMGFGRYVARFAPWNTPEQIKLSETSFRSALSSDFEIEHGTERIHYWYTHGPSSCMSTPVSNYNGDEHALGIYDAPGWGIAFLRTSGDKDRASARSLVWVDPDDESKKHYIRVYGDDVLRVRLERKGFKNEIPYKAPLKYVSAKKSTGNENHTWWPYMDSTNANRNGDGGLIFMDRDRPYLISKAHYETLSKHVVLKRHLRRASSGYWVPTKFMGWYCSTCKKENKDNSQAGWLVGGAKMACPECIKANDLVVALCDAATSNSTITIVPRSETRMGPAVYVAATNSTMSVFVDSAATAQHFGVVRLDPLYYFDTPLEKAAFVYRDTSRQYTPSPGVAWRLSDCVAVYEKGVTAPVVHNMLDNQFVEDPTWIPLYPPSNSYTRIKRHFATTSYANDVAETKDSALKCIPSSQMYSDLLRQAGTNTWRRRRPYGDKVLHLLGTGFVFSAPESAGKDWLHMARTATFSKADLERFAKRAYEINPLTSKSLDAFADAMARATTAVYGVYTPARSTVTKTRAPLAMCAAASGDVTWLLRREVDEVFFSGYCGGDPTDEDKEVILAFRELYKRVRTAWLAEQKRQRGMTDAPEKQEEAEMDDE